MNDIVSLCKSLRLGASVLASYSTDEKNSGLKAVAIALDAHRHEILAANELDVQRALSEGMKESLVDRLRLTSERIDGIIDSIDIVIQQRDPVGQVVAGWTTPNGLRIRQQRVPLGVAAIIYESRPNVTVDAFALAYSGDVDGAEVVSRLGDQVLLQAPLRSHKQKLRLRVLLMHQLGQGDGGIHMARRAAAGEDDAL